MTTNGEPRKLAGEWRKGDTVRTVRDLDQWKILSITEEGEWILKSLNSDVVWYRPSKAYFRE